MAFRESNAFDEAARLLGFGVGGGEIVPERFAVIGVADVSEFVGDDVVEHPLGPAANFVADADVAIGDAAVGAAAQGVVHVADPFYSLPLDLMLKVFLVDVLGAGLQISIGAAYPSFGLFAELLADAVEQMGDVALEGALGDAQ